MTETVADTVTADPRIGTEIAGYRIEHFLGRGGMGTVYLAENLALERKVALKLLAPELSKDERFQQRFRIESRIAASIDHPNVIPIYEAGQAEDGTLFIAMRYVEGADLKRILGEEGALDHERAIDLLAQVAAGLDEAHARGLVHRDVKPSNVLIARSGAGAEHAYIADFGLTKTATSAEHARESITLSGSSDYVSPEQIRGGGSDQASDVYALGCMAYECLTGEVPFRRPGEFEVLFAHLNDEPPPPSAAGAQLPAELDTVVARAMAKDADERPRSATEFVDAVRGALTPRKRRLGRLAALALAAAIAMIVAAAVVPAVLLTGGDSGAQSGAGIITTVAGTGTSGFSGDGGAATVAELSAPSDVAVDAAGNIYFSEPVRVRRVNPDGVITTVAGTGVRGIAGRDGVPATEAQVSYPNLATDQDGHLLLINKWNPILRRVDEDGLIRTVAGTGFASSPPQDGSRATETDICSGFGSPAVDAKGRIYFACTSAAFRIDLDGTITRVAGTDESGFSGDGGPATEARIQAGGGVAVDAEGNLYLADRANDRIRKIDPNGIITTIAGTGLKEHTGDGGPAILASLHEPEDVAADAEGNIFIAFSNNVSAERSAVVRRIDPEGIISTVAGGGTLASDGEGVPATEAQLLGGWQSIGVDAAGNLYIAEPGGHRVRKVTFNE